MTELDTVIHFLDAQRDSVLAILDGLNEEAWRTPVVPSGWTPKGLLAHLCGAERYWLQWVLTGAVTGGDPPPSKEPEEGAPFDLEVDTAALIDFYRRQIALGNANLAAAGLDAVPQGRSQPDHAELASSVRSVALHLLEETARHAGHLDIARELLDGRVGLGPR